MIFYAFMNDTKSFTSSLSVYNQNYIHLTAGLLIIPSVYTQDHNRPKSINITFALSAGCHTVPNR